MSVLNKVTNEAITYHIANSVEDYQDRDLYFSRPYVRGGKMYLKVSDKELRYRVWELEVRAVKGGLK